MQSMNGPQVLDVARDAIWLTIQLSAPILIVGLVVGVVIGRAQVGYLPTNRVVGISKLARVVRGFARRLQIQEKMTAEIADAIDEVLRPQGVGVVIEAEHSCMTVRGVQAAGSRTVTSTLLGTLREDPRSRQEFFALTGVSA